jgi:hypothetical protein
MLIASNHSITFNQIIGSILAVGAFIPPMVCPGYLFAWITNLHEFKSRSVVERLFWSVPLSLAVTTIASELLGKMVSLTAASAFILASAVLCLSAFGWDALKHRRSGTEWRTGIQPLGAKALVIAALWIAVVVLSLVDWESKQRLFSSVTLFDHSARVNWTESVLRTGVPPANPFYYYKHAAAMRSYYFWYVVCAAVTRYSHLPARVVLIASCVWAGFALAALCGLYLKHFLKVGVRLRSQFLICVALLGVTGLDICVNFWDIARGGGIPADLEWWSAAQIGSWMDSLLWVPHHVASMVCCMLALLLAWMAGEKGAKTRIAGLLLISAALASAFGLSVYVAFAFFLVTLTWGLWSRVVERAPQRVIYMAAGGAGALVLLLPYLSELTHGPSGSGGPLFAFAVREMMSPKALVTSPLLSHLNFQHPQAARNLANLILLVPGYLIELGFYAAVFLVYCVPAWRPVRELKPAHRSLLFIVTAAFPFMSLIRSTTLQTNDFGWRGALVLQFPLLLLGSELMTQWEFSRRNQDTPKQVEGTLQRTPHWLRSVTYLALCIGVASTVSQALVLRFCVPVFGSGGGSHDDVGGSSKAPHNAYISALGYAKLEKLISPEAIVQFNPADQGFFDKADILNINRQTAIATDDPACGSELGGDPAGCPVLAAAIDPIFKGGSAEQARAICGQNNIQYLVVRAYDSAWKDKAGWVWTLKPVVADEEFRVLDCR